MLVLVPMSLALAAAAQTPPSPVFFRTKNSDEWVRRTLHIQRQYSRVLMVDVAANPTKSVRIEALELNTRNAKGPRVSVLYPVNEVYKFTARGSRRGAGGRSDRGDARTYAGFVMGDKPDAGDGRYIHFKALGRPGDCTIDRPFTRS